MDVGLTVGDSLDRLDATIAGFDFTELTIGEGGADPADLEEDRLRSLLEQHDVDLCVHLPFQQVLVTGVPELDEAIVAYIERLLRWAGSVDARKAVLHGTVRDPHDTDQRPIFAEQLAAVSEIGDRVGVEVVVENVGHQKRGLQLSVLGDLASETGTSICFDVGHAYVEDGNDGVKRFARKFGDLVSHVHVHDARRRRDTHIPIGAGEIDYGIVHEHLAPFEGTVAVEVFTDDVPLLRDSARRAREHLCGSE